MIKIDPPKAAPSGVYALKKNQESSDLGGAAEKFNIPAVTVGAGQSVAEMKKSQPMGSVDGIFLAVMNPDESKDRALSTGHDLLDKLDQVRIQITLGYFDKESLEKIAALSKRNMDFAVDDTLKNIIKDIQVLAAVELEKLKSRN